MKIEDILQALPSREDLASAIGGERRSAAPGEMLTALGTGILLGAALAVLFAPKAGKDTRHDIGEKLGELGEKFHSPASPSDPSRVASTVDPIA
jgi:hypothetical protein